MPPALRQAHRGAQLLARGVGEPLLSPPHTIHSLHHPAGVCSYCALLVL